ncbi:hypothetical protein KUCAC02_030205, partial [Chaenocephalus aceratus]
SKERENVSMAIRQGECALVTWRWTVRTPAIRSVLKQYESVLMALEEMASCSSPETSAKANGLHGTFLKGNTVLGLLMAEDLMGDLECLNTSLQLRKQTVSGMLEAIHVRKPTKRYTGQAAAHIHPNAQSLYRVQFYNALDTVNTQFIERFEQAGFHKLQQLENVLLHGEMDKVVEEYPELNSRLLQKQLAMFGANYTYETSSDVASIIREMVPEKKLDRLDLEGICQSFISANDKRKKAFGSFT